MDALQTFAKTIYLSQTCQKKDGKMTWFLNLEDAFEDWSRSPARASGGRTSTCRSSSTSSAGFGTTRFGLEQALAVHKKTPLSTHLEIETYTGTCCPTISRPATSSST